MAIEIDTDVGTVRADTTDEAVEIIERLRASNGQASESSAFCEEARVAGVGTVRQDFGEYNVFSMDDGVVIGCGALSELIVDLMDDGHVIIRNASTHDVSGLISAVRDLGLAVAKTRAYERGDDGEWVKAHVFAFDPNQWTDAEQMVKDVIKPFLYTYRCEFGEGQKIGPAAHKNMQKQMDAITRDAT